ncbi:Heterokaryon incompatibility domain-containing protein [Pleurotus pulmonarius]
MGCRSSKPDLSAELEPTLQPSRPLISAKLATASGKASQSLASQVPTPKSFSHKEHSENHTPPPEGPKATPAATDPSLTSTPTSGTHTEPQIVISKPQLDPDVDNEPKSQSEQVYNVCHHCKAGPLAPLSWRSIMNGERFVYEITQSRIAESAKISCALCTALSDLCQEKLPSAGPSLEASITLTTDPHDLVLPPRAQILRIFLRDAIGQIAEGNDYEDLDWDEDDTLAGTWCIYSDPGDPAASEVVAKSPILDRRSSRAYEEAQRALNACLREHDKCRKPPLDTPLPSRVLDCADPSNVRLFVSQGTSSPYVTLSYVWGEPQPYRTITANVDEYIHGIPASCIPQTIRDAVEVTNQLSLRYLWVDALCIIQDSDEDKARELASMARIYSHAYLTIIAASASKASDGFLETGAFLEPYKGNPRLPFHCRDGRLGSMYLFDHLDMEWDQTHVVNGPIEYRAWCFQESVLSPRKLVYGGDALKYYCQTSHAFLGDVVACGSWNRASRRTQGPDPGSDLMLLGDDMPDVSNWSSKEWGKLRHTWDWMVRSYTSRSLTYDEDKLNAFSAVAQVFGRIWGPRAGRYIAGIWENFLLQDLLWRRDPLLTTLTTSRRLPESLIPSWSWASMNGPCTSEWEGLSVWWGDAGREWAQVLKCDAEPKNPNLPFGDVVMPLKLVLRAFVVPIPWMLPLEPGKTSITLSLHARDPSKKETEVKAGCGKELVAVRHTERDDQVRYDKMKEHELPFMGAITIDFDTDDAVVVEKTLAVVLVKYRSEVMGLLVTDNGNGTFRRVALWGSDPPWDESDEDLVPEGVKIPWMHEFGREEDIVLV